MENTHINPANTRDVPGWSDAPVPLCHGGDLRSLAFCCKPGYDLTFGSVCIRDTVLNAIGLTQEEFIKIKDAFSKKHDWDSDLVCFGSMSYCCLRKNGCPGGRDSAIMRRYNNENISQEEIFEKYFTLKKQLAIELLNATKNKKDVEELIKNLE
ncbi:MAG: methanogenesis marker 9 domain-containing protein [DPANN group archaeon]|nr:methanogenesis marker 9 domain-containing protein [DPANN group archaeon]